MEYVCDAPENKTWFRIVTEAEAATESHEMGHAVEKHFRMHGDAAAKSFKPVSTVFFEQAIGLEAHIRREMPMFLTLRNIDGIALATAMLPPRGNSNTAFDIIIVGPGNSDPYAHHAAAIKALGDHFVVTLDRSRCYPYHR